MNKKLKTVWIIPGGGARSVYTAGAVVAINYLKLPKPDIIIAASGGAGAAAYYLAGQADKIRYIWCELLTTKKFANPRRFWKIADIDYLINDVFRRQETLAMDKVEKARVELFISVINAKTGELEYFSNRDKVDLWKVLRATKSVPVFSGIPTPKIKISSDEYCDSTVSSQFHLHVKKAIQLGARKIIVFDSRYPKSGFVNVSTNSRIWLWFCSRGFRRQQLIYMRERNNFTPPQNAEFVHLKPKHKLKIKPWSNNARDLNNCFDLGYNEARELFQKFGNQKTV